MINLLTLKLPFSLLNHHLFFIGISLGLFYSSVQYLLNYFHIKFKKFISLFVITFLNMWVFSKLFYLLSLKIFLIFSGQQNLLYLPYSFFTSLSFWFGEGYYLLGGIFGMLLSFTFCHKLLFPLNTQLLKLMVPPFFLSYAFGKLGCFIYGCCFGKICHIFLCSYFSGHIPVQLIEFILSISIALHSFSVLLKGEFESSNKNFFITYSLLYFIMKFFTEFLRGDDLRGMITWNFLSISLSQLIILFFVFPLLFIYIFKSKPLFKFIFKKFK